MATRIYTGRPAVCNPTVQAIMALVRRGWHARSALAYVTRLFDTGDLPTIKALARDTRGSAATDYALLFAALALGMLAAVATSDLVGGMLAEAVACSLQDTCTGRYPGSDYDWAATPGGEA